MLFFLACDDDTETLTVTETVTVTDTVTEIETDTVTVTEGVEVLISGNIIADAIWSADSVYILGGRIAVISGVTLTIEAGDNYQRPIWNRSQCNGVSSSKRSYLKRSGYVYFTHHLYRSRR